MFEIPILLGTPRKSIALATKKGTVIANEQAPIPTDKEEQQIIRAKHNSFAARWRVRAAPRAGYNCCGHVWASRRTAIFDRPNWELIYAEDGFRRIDREEAEIGDLAIYSWDNAYAHVALVIGVKLENLNPLNPDEVRPVKIFELLSKWDAWSGEFFHDLHDHPWTDEKNLNVEFWTDR